MRFPYVLEYGCGGGNLDVSRGTLVTISGRVCKGFGICNLLMSIDEVCDIGNQIEVGGCDRR